MILIKLPLPFFKSVDGDLTPSFLTNLSTASCPPNLCSKLMRYVTDNGRY